MVAGDSAGGNLALALMLAMRDAGERLPEPAALFSPAADLTGASPSLQRQRGAAIRCSAPATLENLVPCVSRRRRLRRSRWVSPLLGDLTGLPPLLVHVGADEVLRDDSLRLAEKARAAGVRVRAAGVSPTVLARLAE